MSLRELSTTATHVHAHARLAAQASGVHVIVIVVDPAQRGAYQLRCDSMMVNELVGVLQRAVVNIARVMSDEAERRDRAEGAASLAVDLGLPLVGGGASGGGALYPRGGGGSASGGSGSTGAGWGWRLRRSFLR